MPCLGDAYALSGLSHKSREVGSAVRDFDFPRQLPFLLLDSSRGSKAMIGRIC